MTLEEAFIEFSSSANFKEVAKQKDRLGGKYRQYLSRFKKGQLGSGAIVELLIENGYTIRALKNGKKMVKKFKV